MIRRVVLICLLLVTALWLCGCQLSPYLPFMPAPTEEAPIVGPCVGPLPLPGDLVSLYFSESHSYRKRVQGYEFRNEDGKLTAYFEMADEAEAYPVPVDEAWVEALTEIVQLNNVILWDGFNKSFDELLDGTSFDFSLEFSDGTTVYARGYGQFPEGYGDVTESINTHFMQLLPEDMRSW